MPVQPAYGNGGNNNGFGGDGWWAILFLIAIMCGGWGGFGGFGGMGGLMGMWPFMFGGFGNWGNGGNSGALTRGDLCQDMNFNDLQNGVRNVSDAVNQGFANLNSTICHQQYDTAQMINGVTAAVNGGFSALNSTICQQQYDTAQQLNAMNMANMQNANAANVVAMQNANAIQTQLADCCCKEQTSLMQLGNQVERGFCQTNYNDQANTTAIIQNAHGDTDRILARLDAMERNQDKDTIANLRAQLAACGDQSTANYIINQVRGIVNPTPVPAYPAASPCGLGNWAPQVLAGGYNYGGYNGGCCGCNG